MRIVVPFIQKGPYRLDGFCACKYPGCEKVLEPGIVWRTEDNTLECMAHHTGFAFPEKRCEAESL